MNSDKIQKDKKQTKHIWHWLIIPPLLCLIVTWIIYRIGEYRVIIFTNISEGEFLTYLGAVMSFVGVTYFSYISMRSNTNFENFQKQLQINEWKLETITEIIPRRIYFYESSEYIKFEVEPCKLSFDDNDIPISINNKVYCFQFVSDYFDKIPIKSSVYEPCKIKFYFENEESFEFTNNKYDIDHTFMISGEERNYDIMYTHENTIIKTVRSFLFIEIPDSILTRNASTIEIIGYHNLVNIFNVQVKSKISFRYNFSSIDDFGYQWFQFNSKESFSTTISADYIGK